MKLAALFLGLAAGLFGLLAPIALDIDLLTPFLKLWSDVAPNGSTIGLIVWYAIPAAAVIGGVLAPAMPGLAATLLTAAAAGWVGTGLALPELFGPELITPAAASGGAALCALIAGELDIRRRRMARRRHRAAATLLDDPVDDDRETALTMDPLLMPRSTTSQPRRASPLTAADVSVTGRASEQPAVSNAPAPPFAEEHLEEPDEGSGALYRRAAFRWDRSDAPAGQRLEIDPASSPRLSLRTPEPAPAVTEVVEDRSRPEPEARRPEPTSPPPRKRRRSIIGPVMGAIGLILVLFGLAAGGYYAYRSGWLDQAVAMVMPPATSTSNAAPQATAAASPVTAPDPAPTEPAPPPVARLELPAAPAAPAQPTPAPAAATSTVVAAVPEVQTFADPFSYCRSVGTIDFIDSRYRGPTVAEPVTRALSLPGASGQDKVHWRCLRGAVLACSSYVGPVCDMTPTVLEMRAFCARNADIANLTAPKGNWACVAGRPVIPEGQSWPVDERGFLPTSWVVVPEAG